MDFKSIGDIGNPFRGTFDGQGHVIRNLKITGEGYKYNGLFGYTNNTTIKNVGIVDTQVNITTTISSSDTTGSGGICGYLSGTISNCFNTGEIYVESSSSASAGGISGLCSDSIINNCYNEGEVSVS